MQSGSWRRQSAASVSSSSREKTFPVGLCGVLRSRTRVFGGKGAPRARADRTSSPERGASRLAARRPPSRRSPCTSRSTARRGRPRRPASQTPWIAEKIASVAPEVTVSSVSGAYSSPQSRRYLAESARWISGIPVMRAYCPCPARIAATAASRANSGPSKSGNPWARLIAPCSFASRVISVKIVVPKPSSLRESAGRMLG